MINAYIALWATLLNPHDNLRFGVQMINILTILLLPLFLPGLISRVKAIMVGRKGQSLFQQYFHFFKLIRKDEVISTSASFFTRAAPSLASCRNPCRRAICANWRQDGTL